MRSPFRRSALSFVLVLLLVALAAPAAGALDTLQRNVEHINVLNLPVPLQRTAWASARTTLRFLELPDTTDIHHIADFGRSLNPTFTPERGLDHAMTTNTFYSTIKPDPNPEIPVEDHGLGEFLKPMTTSPYASRYVAVVPVPEPATPSPLCLGRLVMLKRPIVSNERRST